MPRLEDNGSTSYCRKVCAICSACWRSRSRLFSMSSSGVALIFRNPQIGKPCNMLSNSALESASKINTAALSPTGKPPL